jgi:hypothetical protein
MGSGRSEVDWGVLPDGASAFVMVEGTGNELPYYKPVIEILEVV